MTRSFFLASLAWLATCGVAPASSFTILPPTVNGLPGETVGFGFELVNTTNSWLVPMGLSQAGLTSGTLIDVFLYSPVAPNSTMNTGYSFVPPGGAGFSLGLYEYSIPLAALPGETQDVLVLLQYQLFSANPDINPLAIPVSALLEFDQAALRIQAAAPGGFSVPEPGPIWLLLGAVGALGFRSRSLTDTASRRTA